MKAMLFTTEVAETYEVVYNLYEVAEGFFLPSAYIVSRDKEGFLAHIRQKAVRETIGHFQLELDDVRGRLFDIIDQLQPKNLEKRFSPPKRKEKTLDELLADAEVQKVLLAFAHKRLDELLSHVVQYRLPLTWNVDRRVLVKDFLVRVSQETLEPDLAFRRTREGVQYRLRLRKGDLVWKVSSRDVIPVTNHPAWLLVDDTLFRAAHINGNMVKPFRTRDVVSIPQASVKTYFQKFILKIASQIDIEAEGFDIHYFDRLKTCRLEVNHSFFSSEAALLAYMVYPKAEFLWNDRRTKRTTLEFTQEEVGIIQIRRDMEAEQVYLGRLKNLGLVENAQGQFGLSDPGPDPLALVHWVIRNRLLLEEAGFVLSPIQMEDKVVYLQQATLHMQTERAIDWFDIYGEVVIGEFTIPFLALAKFIRDDNHFYPLPNGMYFLIPQEWMEKYKSLVQFARKEGKHLRLNKSQFTLLSEIGLSEHEEGAPALVEVDFQISPLLKATLRPYQTEGARWLVQLYRNKLGGCLADDMGLGKTVQTIAALLYAKEHKAAVSAAEELETANQLDLFSAKAGDEDFLQPLNALIILPASLVFNWEAEIRKFAPSLSTYRHVGGKRYRDIRLLRRFDVILTTYQTALRDVELLQQLEYEYIVLDESQQIKNRDSKVYHAINYLNGKHKISLSGTPIENSLSDLWAQMQFINPDLLGNFSFFKKEFITPIEKYQDEGKKYRLRALVAPYLLRRTKEEVAQDLPPLSTQVFYSEMTPEQKKLYEREKSAARNYLLENFDANNPQYRILVLRSLTKLRQICNHPRIVNDQYQRESGKFNDVLEHWDVIRKSNHKALFFSSFVQYLELFREEFEARRQPFSMLTGNMSPQERQSNIQVFEDKPEVQSFLISIKSGGVGLNLTAADYVFILDPWWNPTTEQQAIARAHRIGQDKNVIAVKFITKDSIEEKILKLQERKSKLAEDIIENVRRADFSIGDIEYLLE